MADAFATYQNEPRAYTESVGARPVVNTPSLGETVVGAASNLAKLGSTMAKSATVDNGEVGKNIGAMIALKSTIQTGEEALVSNPSNSLRTKVNMLKEVRDYAIKNPGSTASLIEGSRAAEASRKVDEQAFMMEEVVMKQREESLKQGIIANNGVPLYDSNGVPDYEATIQYGNSLASLGQKTKQLEELQKQNKITQEMQVDGIAGIMSQAYPSFINASINKVEQATAGRSFQEGAKIKLQWATESITELERMKRSTMSRFSNLSPENYKRLSDHIDTINKPIYDFLNDETNITGAAIKNIQALANKTATGKDIYAAMKTHGGLGNNGDNAALNIIMQGGEGLGQLAAMGAIGADMQRQSFKDKPGGIFDLNEFNAITDKVNAAIDQKYPDVTAAFPDNKQQVVNYSKGLLKSSQDANKIESAGDANGLCQGISILSDALFTQLDNMPAEDVSNTINKSLSNYKSNCTDLMKQAYKIDPERTTFAGEKKIQVDSKSISLITDNIIKELDSMSPEQRQLQGDAALAQLFRTGVKAGNVLSGKGSKVMIDTNTREIGVGDVNIIDRMSGTVAKNVELVNRLFKSIDDVGSVIGKDKEVTDTLKQKMLEAIQSRVQPTQQQRQPLSSSSSGEMPTIGREFTATDVESNNTGNGVSIGETTFNLIKGPEGFKSTPYKDQAGNWSIGFGSRDKELIAKGRITEQEAKQAMMQHLEKEVAPFIQRQITVPLSQSQLDSLASFIYNVGGTAFTKSDIPELINSGDWEGAAAEMLQYNKITTKKGKVITSKGLVKRRELETSGIVE